VINKTKKIYYIVEPANWVINWEGIYISKYIRLLYNKPVKLLKPSKLRLSIIKNQIIHFGSRNVYLPQNYKYVNENNNLILTWYHGTDRDIQYIESLKEASKELSIIHTSCTISKDNLIRWGVDKDKIVVIPIGVDIKLFREAAAYNRESIREKLGIPAGSICIGSFQKDGEGWEEGNSPKYVKAPDVFCEVVKRLGKRYPVFVLLSGPARGYVKNQLQSSGIPFKHLYLKDYQDIAELYRAIDLYIVSSRAEGGPKALLESFASEVPLVSTDVGMVHDIGINGYNSMISKIDDVESLTRNCERIIDDENLRKKIIRGGFETVKDFDWNIIAKRYYEEIYSRFL
jgi:glycosyltransferase involved in cell wall biosynthesis